MAHHYTEALTTTARSSIFEQNKLEIPENFSESMLHKLKTGYATKAMSGLSWPQARCTTNHQKPW